MHLVVGRFCGPVTGVRRPYHHESPLSKLHATLTVGTLGLAYLGHAETGNLMVQRRERRLQQRAVERTEQGKARGATWSSTASVSITSCLDQVLPLDIGGHGRESEVDIVQLLFTLNKVITQVIYHPSSHSHKSCGDRQAAKQQVWVHWQL